MTKLHAEHFPATLHHLRILLGDGATFDAHEHSMRLLTARCFRTTSGELKRKCRKGVRYR